MKKIVNYLIPLFCLPLLYKAQFPSVLISREFEPEEVTIAINSKNPAQVIAGANLSSSYFSQDTGRTWIRKGVTCDPFNVYGDPVVFWDTLQNAYFMHLSFPNPKLVKDASWVDRIVVNKSTDQGQTYPTCTGIGKVGKKVQDKPWFAVDRKTNTLHVAWTQFDVYESKDPKDSSVIRYSQSKDGGQTWSEPQRISFYGGDCLDSDNTVEGATPCVGDDGTLYVFWAGPKGLVFQRSADGGQTWMPQEKIIGPVKNGWDYKVDGVFRANGMPFSAADVSPTSSYKGRIYVCYSDEKNGEKNKDVFLVYSDDRGEHWSDPILITYFPNHKEQFMQHFTIDAVTGYLYALYYDRRNYMEGHLTDVYLSVSRDGGTSWSHHRITEKPFLPHKDVFFGDYIGVSAHNGIVRPIWMQLDSAKKLAVYTCLLSDKQLQAHMPAAPDLQLDKSKDWLYDQKIKLNFTLSKAQKVSIAVYDPLLAEIQVQGNGEGKSKILETVIVKDKLFGKGTHTYVINAKKLKLDNKTRVIAFYSGNVCQTNWLLKKEP
ncbi:MAG: sialidase family protein [Sediminibacterium sp.]|nr:sialidase family protein [Sediminibacterium sp.]